MALSFSTPTSDYSGSSLRFGLLDIKPFEVAETVKRYGLKFQRIKRIMKPLRPTESYADMVIFENESIFAKIDVPSWFDSKELVKIYSQRSIEDYEKDHELQEAIDKMRKSDRIEGPLLSFISFMKKRFETKRDHWIKVEAARFLTSNFPLSFYNQFVILSNTYYNFLNFLETTVGQYEYRARYARNFQMYSKHIEKLKRVVKPLINQMDSCFFLDSCLKDYVILWNAKTYEEAKGPDFLDVTNVDSSKLKQLETEFKTNLTKTRRLLVKYDPEILRMQINKDETAEMFGKLVIQSDSLSFKR